MILINRRSYRFAWNPIFFSFSSDLPSFMTSAISLTSNSIIALDALLPHADAASI